MTMLAKTCMRLLLVLVVALGAARLISAADGTKPTSNDVAVIVHTKNSVENLSLSRLRQVFRGDQRFWNGNVPVLLIIRAPGAPERDVALKEVLAMSETEY